MSIESRTNMAVLPMRHRWPVAIGLGLVPVLLTVVGNVIAGATGASQRDTYLIVAGAVTVSTLIGLLVMVQTKPTLTEYGFSSPINVSVAWWFVPMVVLPVIVFVATGFTAAPALIPGFIWLAVAVGFNEEVWYRGLVISVLRSYGLRYAVVAQAVLFAVLHLANLLGGRSIGYALLQLLFSGLFGLVAGLLYVLTHSLWPVIAAHFAYDAAALLGGDAMTTPALIGLGVMVVILASYATHLWRHLPR